MSRTVLVTGVARDLGRRFARQIAASPEVSRVIGVDVQPPRGDLGTVQFVRADIRNPVIAKVIVREQVDTVVHMSVLGDGEASGRTSAKELNVIGTMQLLAGCQQAPDLRHLVVKSSTAVYGASNRDPAMFSADMGAKRQLRSGFGKDVTEVESYVRGFARRRPDVRVTTLRTAPAIGAGVHTSLTAYFRLPVVPTVLGFDARLQFLHETDVLDVLEHAVREEVAGTFNVAGDGIVMLSQAVRRLGRPAIPVPGFALSQFGSVVRPTRLAALAPERVAFLTFGRGVDTTRMRDVLGFRPSYTSAEAFAGFARALGPGPLSAERVQRSESAVAHALGVSGGGGADG
jgi:UDP-glucose 4-epimerase